MAQHKEHLSGTAVKTEGAASLGVLDFWSVRCSVRVDNDGFLNCLTFHL